MHYLEAVTHEVIQAEILGLAETLIGNLE